MANITASYLPMDLLKFVEKFYRLAGDQHDPDLHATVDILRGEAQALLLKARMAQKVIRLNARATELIRFVKWYHKTWKNVCDVNESTARAVNWSGKLIAAVEGRKPR